MSRYPNPDAAADPYAPYVRADGHYPNPDAAADPYGQDFRTADGNRDHGYPVPADARPTRPFTSRFTDQSRLHVEDDRHPMTPWESIKGFFRMYSPVLLGQDPNAGPYRLEGNTTDGAPLNSAGAPMAKQKSDPRMDALSELHSMLTQSIGNKLKAKKLSRDPVEADEPEEQLGAKGEADENPVLAAKKKMQFGPGHKK